MINPVFARYNDVKTDKKNKEMPHKLKSDVVNLSHIVDEDRKQWAKVLNLK